MLQLIYFPGLYIVASILSAAFWRPEFQPFSCIFFFCAVTIVSLQKGFWQGLGMTCAGVLTTGLLMQAFDGQITYASLVIVFLLSVATCWLAAQRLSAFMKRKEELRRSEEMFRLLVDGVQDYAIFMLDPKGFVRSWNAGAERIKGYKAGEIIGQHFSKFYSSEDRQAGKPEQELELAIKQGSIKDEGWRIRKDGSRFWADVLITALKDEDGDLRGFAKVTRDLTQHKNLEEEQARLAQEQAARAEAERAVRMKDEFLAVVSHELRTPLTPILGWTRIFESGKQIDPQILQRGLEAIRRNVNAEVKLVEDLLDISRIASGKMRIEIEPVGLVQVIESAMQAAKDIAATNQVDLVFTLEGSVEPVAGDADRLQQIVWNLLTNAIKFNKTGGKVEIKLRQKENQAELEVLDTGEGIEPAFLSRIFKRFNQNDSSITRRHGGLG
jgi:PAS domain S-box-containing protein